MAPFFSFLSLQPEELEIKWFNLDVRLELHGGRQPPEQQDRAELLQAYPEEKRVCSPIPPLSQTELSPLCQTSGKVRTHRLKVS